MLRQTYAQARAYISWVIVIANDSVAGASGTSGGHRGAERQWDRGDCGQSELHRHIAVAGRERHDHQKVPKGENVVQREKTVGRVACFATALEWRDLYSLLDTAIVGDLHGALAFAGSRVHLVGEPLLACRPTRACQSWPTGPKVD